MDQYNIDPNMWLQAVENHDGGYDYLGPLKDELNMKPYRSNQPKTAAKSNLIALGDITFGPTSDQV
jgi:hypothetical protein